MYDGYIHWPDLLGESRYHKNPNALWHVANPVEDYAAEAEKVFPGRYKTGGLQGRRRVLNRQPPEAAAGKSRQEKPQTCNP